MASELQCAYCFDAIVEHVDKKEKIKTLGVNLTEKQKFPLFVTWKKRSSSHSGDWRLRGCIGTFAPKELVKGLKEYAVISAFQDRRFPAVKLDEIPQLRCDVSLLTNFEPAEHYQDWVIGKHGLTIDFHDPITHASHSATYLPDVASEQGWDHITTFDELIAKSGYRGPITNILRQNLKITRYQSSKASLTYDQYEAMRGKIS